MNMYKGYMLECSVYNEYKGIWQNDRYFFDTQEDMIDFVKNGNKYHKPEHIRVGAAFKLSKLDSGIFIG